MPDLSVVIVSYNVRHLLSRCLETLYSNTTGIDFETILVDNHSADDTVAYTRQHFPQVHLIANQDNAGFPKANNQAFRMATGKYILMLNPDTETQPGAIHTLLQYLKANEPAVGLVGPKLLNTDGTHQYSAWKFPTIKYIVAEQWFLSTLIRDKYYKDKDLSKIIDVDSLSGAAILFNKDILGNIGDLDESLFWIEDVDFCYRAKQVGYRVVYNPEAAIIHHIGQSAKKNYNISLSNQVYNKIKFYKTHHAGLWIFVALASFFSVLAKIAVFACFAPLGKVYYLKMRAYIYTLPRIFNPPKGIK